MKKSILILIGMTLISCSGRPNMKVGITYPDMISPIYFLDTFQIQKPIVVYINSLPYITSDEVFNNVPDKTALSETRGVTRYLTEDLVTNKAWDFVKIYNTTEKTDDKSFYHLQYMNSFLNIEHNLNLLDSMQGIAIYRFDVEPQNFLLTLIAKKDSLITSYGGTGNLANDVILGVEYSNDYMLAIAPLFSTKDKIILDEKCNGYHR